MTQRSAALEYERNRPTWRLDPFPGFGQSAADSAGLVLVELDDTNKQVCKHELAALRKAGSYTQLSSTIKTGKSTAKVRFLLDTVLHCPYTEGHVTYDDCDFRAGGSLLEHR